MISKMVVKVLYNNAKDNCAVGFYIETCIEFESQ